MEVHMTQHNSLAKALAAFQAEVPKMSRDETAKVRGETKDGRAYDRSYTYTGLDQFVEIVEPVLGKHGLSVTSAPVWEDGRFMLVVTLLHESGDERNGYWPLPDPAGRGIGPQDIGSAMTYGRRYVGWGLTGTFPGGIDDDGKQAQQSAQERWEDARPVQRPVDDRQAQAGQEPQAAPAAPPVKTSWTDGEVADYQAKLSQSDLAMAVKGYDWMASKDLHNRLVGTPDGVTATTIMALRLADEAMMAYVTPAEVDGLKAIAADRGLLKIQVSEEETLDQALFGAKELAQHAADTPDVQADLNEQQGD
jgi:hypothetical protein